MDDRIIGVALWHASKWYLRRRLRRNRRKVAIAGLSALVVIGVLVAQRRVCRSPRPHPASTAE